MKDLEIRSYVNCLKLEALDFLDKQDMQRYISKIKSIKVVRDDKVGVTQVDYLTIKYSKFLYHLDDEKVIEILKNRFDYIVRNNLIIL